MNTIEHWVRKYLKEETDYSYLEDKLEQYILVISNKTYNVVKDLNIGSNKATRISKKLYPTKSSGMKPHIFILNYYSKKYCVYCEEVRDKIEFHSNVTTRDGLQGRCKFCNKDKYLEDKGSYKNRAVKYNVKKQKQTPLWGQEGINNFYNKCPKGQQVDHIIPLNGKYVSGLHVISNLQYLSALDNNRKSNYHISEEFNV